MLSWLHNFLLLIYHKINFTCCNILIDKWFLTFNTLIYGCLWSIALCATIFGCNFLNLVHYNLILFFRFELLKWMWVQCFGMVRIFSWQSSILICWLLSFLIHFQITNWTSLVFLLTNFVRLRRAINLIS